MHSPSPLQKRITLLATTLCLLASPLIVSAQERPKPQGGEIVDLPKFEVSAQSNVGYGTTSSLSASRIALPVIDLAASVITINENLIADTVAVDLADTFNLVSGIVKGNQGTGLQEQAQLSIRGYRSSGAFRDGLPDLNYTDNGGFDYSMLERVEIIKGPAGVLYGQHNGGGVINIISKRPLSKPMTKLSLTAASYNFWRAEVDTSGFVDQAHRLGYRLSTSVLNTDGPVGLAGEPTQLSHWINPSLSYLFKSGVKVWTWAAFVDDHSKRVAESVWAFGTPDRRGRPYYKFMDSGKLSVVYQNFIQSKNTNYEAGVSHSFAFNNLNADVRVIGRYGDLFHTADRTRSNGGAVFIASDGTLIPDVATGTGPNMYAAIDGRLARFGRAGLRYNKGGSWSTNRDLLADLNLRFDVGPTSHNLLVTSQGSDYEVLTRSRDIQVAAVTRLPADIRAKFRFDTTVAGVGMSEVWPNPPSGVGDLRDLITQYATSNTGGQAQTVDTKLRNVGVMDSMSVLKNRVILVGGIRYDQNSSVANQPETARFVPIKTSVSTSTSKVGAVVKPYVGEYGEASVFYNHADTLVPEFGLDRRLATFGRKLPDRRIYTDEIGVKMSLLHGRLVGTAAHFNNRETNALISFADEAGLITGIPGSSYTVPSGEALTNGYELDLAYSPTPELNCLVSYSRTDTSLSDGLPNDGIPRFTFAATAHYTFTKGVLKGASIGWIYNSWGESFTSRSSNMIMPAGDLQTAVLGYNWRNYTVRFRIENLVDDIHATPSTFWTGIGVTKPMNYRLNITAKF